MCGDHKQIMTYIDEKVIKTDYEDFLRVTVRTYLSYNLGFKF